MQSNKQRTHVAPVLTSPTSHVHWYVLCQKYLCDENVMVLRRENQDETGRGKKEEERLDVIPSSLPQHRPA